MFQGLKKLFSFIRKGKKTGKEKKAKIKAKKEKKRPFKQKKTDKSSLTKAEKQTEQEVEQILQETKRSVEQEEEPILQTGEILEKEQAEQAEKYEQQLEEETEKPEAKENFFSKLFKKITSSKLTQQDFDDVFYDLELTLLENNVALEAVDKIKESLSMHLIGQQIKKTEAPARIQQALKDSILSILHEPPDLIEQIKGKKDHFTIIFFGINGTGKTTSIAKIAHLLKKSNISSVLAAADTFRAASIEQLKTHASALSIPIISSEYGADPASVAFDSISYAQKHKIKVVLIDTAGRMYTKENLLREMEKIIRISKPDLKFFVGESITGNDAIEQAKTFNEAIGIDGIILTKADIDEKSGTILSVSYITGKPIYFLGTGQSLDDLLPFTKKEVLKHLGLE